MNIQIQSIHFSADQKLKDYVQKKVIKLEKFDDNIIEIRVNMKLENSGQVRDKIVEIITRVPGETFVSTEGSKTFESAFDLSLDSLKRQIKRHKEKIISRKRSSQQG